MSAPSNPSPPMNEDSSPDGKPLVRSSRSIWYALLGLALVWGAILLSLVLFTANPVTLNWEQIQLQAQMVISAEVLNVESGKVKVTRVWKEGGPVQPEQELLILNLKQTPARNGESYLIPVIKSGPVAGAYTIPMTQEQLALEEKGKEDIQPYCYPLSDDVVKQLESLLAQPLPTNEASIPR